MKKVTVTDIWPTPGVRRARHQRFAHLTCPNRTSRSSLPRTTCPVARSYSTASRRAVHLLVRAPLCVHVAAAGRDSLSPRPSCPKRTVFRVTRARRWMDTPHRGKHFHLAVSWCTLCRRWRCSRARPRRRKCTWPADESRSSSSPCSARPPPPSKTGSRG